jgi:hypothetical protein
MRRNSLKRFVATGAFGAAMELRGGIFHDRETPDRYVETFIVSSWAEHLRQHERMTLADRELEERRQRYVRGNPRIRHLVSAT